MMSKQITEKNATKLSTPPNTLSPRWISLCWKQLWSPKWGEKREKQASSPPPVSFLSNILTAFTQLGSHPCRPSLPPEQPSMKHKNFVRKKKWCPLHLPGARKQLSSVFWLEFSVYLVGFHEMPCSPAGLELAGLGFKTVLFFCQLTSCMWI